MPTLRRLCYVFRLHGSGDFAEWKRETVNRSDLVYTGRINTTHGEMVTARFRQPRGRVTKNAFETVLVFPREWNGRG